MKIIKFKKKEKFKYKRKVIIKDLTLSIFVGIHSFERKKKQRVKFLIKSKSITGEIINIDGGQRLAWQTPDIINTKE